MRFILLLLFGILPYSFFAQTKTGKSYDRAVSGLSTNKKTVTRFTVPENSPGHSVTILKTPFAEAGFISASFANAAKGKAIEKIQLVYTTFAVSPSFDQKGLNGRRLTNLFSVLPDAFESALTEWELVAQTGAASPEEGRDYFHGFIITWRPDASPELIRQEIRMMDSLFWGTKTGGGSSTSTDKIPSGETGGGSTELFKTKTLTLTDGTKLVIDRDIPEDSLWRYMRPSGKDWSVIHARYGDSAHTVVIVTEMSESGYQQKRVWKLEEHKGGLTMGGGFSNLVLNTPDSVVLTVLRRNGWTNMTIVTDVTGSMSPYTAQMFSWLPAALSAKKCAGFVFFNDGDKKKNSDKNIGKTGGIYSTKSLNYDSICNTAKLTMQNGDGGDSRENDLEAVLYAINTLNPTGDIVLIADNWGPPRDLELFRKLDRPVHIVLCGALGGVNPDYLFLARMTGGTIHTLKDDITNLSTMKDGETVKIGYQTFLLSNDHFVPLENFRKW